MIKQQGRYHTTLCTDAISTLPLREHHHQSVCHQVLVSLGNSGLWTLFTQNRDTAVPAEGNGNLQTLICVLMARPGRCPTLSNPVPSQNWMAAYLGYTLRMKMLFHGWPIMVHETHTRRRRRVCHLSCQWSSLAVSCHDIWNRAQFTVCRHCGCFRETQVIRDNGVSPY